jgi:hypothetical protein
MKADQSATQDVIDASKIKRANIGNIVRKLRDGKTLTANERKALEEYQSDSGESDDGWVKDISALSKELGLSRQAIYEARARYPNEAPKKEPGSRRENLVAWQKFCAEKLIGKDTATKTLADLKADLMREQIKLARNKNRREEGDSIDRSIVEEMLALLGQKLDLLLRLKLEVELGPRVAGKSAAEINSEGRLMLDEIREVIAGNIATFERDAVNQTRRSDSDEAGTDRTSES